mmetsp:Transcript_38576/g.114576  ORF Transcript_38576/g.114576 Transcript_38576/m.114576 type:complete len:232 (+) Transcript_38576:765-1460(+)
MWGRVRHSRRSPCRSSSGRPGNARQATAPSARCLPTSVARATGSAPGKAAKLAAVALVPSGTSRAPLFATAQMKPHTASPTVPSSAPATASPTPPPATPATASATASPTVPAMALATAPPTAKPTAAGAQMCWPAAQAKKEGAQRWPMLASSCTCSCMASTRWRGRRSQASRAACAPCRATATRACRAICARATNTCRLNLRLRAATACRWARRPACRAHMCSVSSSCACP